MSVRIDSNIKAVIAKYDKFGERVVRPATSRAINDATKATQTQFAREMATEGIAMRAAKGATRIIKSWPSNLYGAVIGSGSPIPLKYFNARQTGAGASARIRGERWVIPGAFKVQSLGGHVFKRKGVGRFPIRKVYGPPLPVNVTDQRLSYLQGYAVDWFVKRLEPWIARYLKR